MTEESEEIETVEESIEEYECEEPTPRVSTAGDEMLQGTVACFKERDYSVELDHLSDDTVVQISADRAPESDE